ncbi:regulatory protein RecX [Aeromicrobium sp. CTD01-1L150]|uniref:regulatory protein RecX n=1 Tax=Aeromicrobium sp. CTD01-1L150 TaxID=3341830 RepID=UPI0035BFD08D
MSEDEGPGGGAGPGAAEGAAGGAGSAGSAGPGSAESAAGGAGPQATEKTESVARTILQRRLAERDHSRAELAQFLARKHVPVEVGDRLLDRFEEVGLIDDESFARAWVESRQRSKGTARSVLAMELRRKGIDDDLVTEVLADLDPEQEREAAHRLVQKKLRSLHGLDDTTRIRRLTGMLARKGYSPQVAFDVVRTELDAEPEPIESL